MKFPASRQHPLHRYQADCTVRPHRRGHLSCNLDRIPSLPHKEWPPVFYRTGAFWFCFNTSTIRTLCSRRALYRHPDRIRTVQAYSSRTGIDQFQSSATFHRLNLRFSTDTGYEQILRVYRRHNARVEQLLSRKIWPSVMEMTFVNIWKYRLPGSQ